MVTLLEKSGGLPVSLIIYKVKMSIVRAFLTWFSGLFKPKPPVLPVPTPPETLIIPHPEEPKDLNQTVANVNIPEIIRQWLTVWAVPPAFHQYWIDKVNIELVPNLQVVVNGVLMDVPAAAYDNGNGTRSIKIRPEWLNKGVIAHEQAHNSYWLLNLVEKDAFAVGFDSCKKDKLVEYLFSINAYGLTSYIEGHAEIYRYLGDKMPSCLKKYYPKLMV